MRTACKYHHLRLFLVVTDLTDVHPSYFIKDGSVCELGTHDELLRQKGEYYAYVQLQALTNK